MPQTFAGVATRGVHANANSTQFSVLKRSEIPGSSYSHNVFHTTGLVYSIVVYEYI